MIFSRIHISAIREGIHDFILVVCSNNVTILHCVIIRRWLRGTEVERRSLAGELSLSCARPVAHW